MNCDTIRDHLDRDEAILLDVRTPNEFAARRLERAVNIPLNQLQARVNELDPTKKVYVYCQSGSRSQVATLMLSSVGYDITNIGGVIHHPDCTDPH